MLLWVLGVLCVECQLWGKAQAYLEESLGLRRTRAAHVALARLFDATDREADANRQYRLAAEVQDGH